MSPKGSPLSIFKCCNNERAITIPRCSASSTNSSRRASRSYESTFITATNWAAAVLCDAIIGLSPLAATRPIASSSSTQCNCTSCGFSSSITWSRGFAASPGHCPLLPASGPACAVAPVRLAVWARLVPVNNELVCRRADAGLWEESTDE